MLNKNKWLLIFIISLSPQIQADGEQSALKITPNRCISLHQGQVCYQRATLSWQTLDIADYCLFQAREDKPLKCWTAASSGVFETDFQSTEPVRYYLFKVGEDTPLASSGISVSWVYKSSKRQRRSWRLF